MKLVCYYPTWTYYRQGDAKFTVEHIDPSICSHIIYSFAILDPTTYLMKVHDSWLDIDLRNIKKFTEIKSQYPHVMLLLALGGWNDSRTSKYSELLAASSKRSTFVHHAVSFIRDLGFDGLDLDYEYPGSDGVTTDREGFTALVKELSEAFKPHDLELTAAVSASKSITDSGYDVEEVCKYLDGVHLMCYDLHGSWEQQVDHHAKLYGDQGDQLTVDFAVNHWINKGCPRNKLIVGIPTYGRSWTLSGASTCLKSSASGPGSAGPKTGESGFLANHEICNNLENEGWTKVCDESGKMGPYAYRDNQWVGYDDSDMAGVKARYIVSNQLGGAMFWDLASDDFSNQFGEGHYPIIRKVAEVFQFAPAHNLSKTTKDMNPASISSSSSLRQSPILSQSSCDVPEPSLVTCKFQVKIESRWPNHMQGTLEVTFPTDVMSFKLQMETDQPVQNCVMWDADVEVQALSKVIRVTNKHWFGGKRQGELLELGFQMKFETAEAPTIISINLIL